MGEGDEGDEVGVGGRVCGGLGVDGGGGGVVGGGGGGGGGGEGAAASYQRQAKRLLTLLGQAPRMLHRKP